jgi:hypothetical protein
MPALDQLTYTALTAAINEMKSPNQFLRRRLFSRHEAKHTEHIELSLLTRSRKIAPFVKKNAAAVMVTGHGREFQNIEPTNIRIKRPFTPSELLFGRRPGGVIFATPQEQSQAVDQHIATDLQGMADDIVNAEEWLAAMAIRGSISYEAEGGDAWTIDFSKPSAHIIVLTGSRLWDTADATLVQIEEDVITAQRLVNDEHGLNITDCVLGQEASTQFRRVLKANKMLDMLHVNVGGTLDLQRQFTEDGVLFLGRLFGIDWWEYSRSADLNGVSTPMVRSKYAEFLSVTPAAQNVLYYGAVADIKTLRGQRIVTERFSKSWEQEDPSVMWALASSRPLPVTRRPGSTVSMKVVSGS